MEELGAAERPATADVEEVKKWKLTSKLLGIRERNVSGNALEQIARALFSYSLTFGLGDQCQEDATRLILGRKNDAEKKAARHS